jgi:Flp pilus assembly protein TadG
MFQTQRSERQRGATAVIVALLLTVLCGFMALVINSGHLGAVRGQLQNATDAAALAGVRELNGTPEGVTSARTVATDYAQRHFTDKGMEVTIDRDADVEVGIWDFAAPRESAFTAVTDWTAANLAAANAVLVNAGREASRGNSVKVTMGGLLGKKQTDVTASSVAVLGGPIKECLNIPLAFSDCAVRDENGNLKCNQVIEFHSDLEDSVGFTNLSADATVSVDVLKKILTSDCRDVGVGDPISVGNGAELNPLRTFFLAFQGDNVVVPVVDLPDCQFNARTTTVTGFLTIKIIDVYPPPSSNIAIEIQCNQTTEHITEGGAPYNGTAATIPRLVR